MILIINSPLFGESNPKYDEDSLPPIGLGYIATQLKKKNIKVKLIDAVASRLSLKDLLVRINKVKPKFIGLNIFTTNYDLVREICESIDFKTHFLIGGLSTKELHEKIILWKTNNNIDVVIGDGELIVSDLVKNKLIEKPAIQKDNRRVFKIFNNSKYYVKDISNIHLDRSFFKNEPVYHPLGFVEANIIASRGCIYNCKFCAAASSLNKEYGIRERSVISIRQEIEQIKNVCPEVNSIRVLDDLFLKNSNSVNNAIKTFSGLKLKWRSMAHVLTFKKVNHETLIQLKKSGCKELFIGIESGSPKILKSINKTRDIDLIEEHLSLVLKAGIGIKAYFIYGFPGETEYDMDLTYALAYKLKHVADQFNTQFRTSVFQYRPYHGTELYHEIADKGIDTNVENVQPNHILSDKVGRLQFNFHSGNYSEVCSEKLYDYIYRTTLLRNVEVEAKIRKSKYTKNKKSPKIETMSSMWSISKSISHF